MGRSNIVTLDQQPVAAELSSVSTAPTAQTQIVIDEDARDSRGLEKTSHIIRTVSEESESPPEHLPPAAQVQVRSHSVPSVPLYPEQNFRPWEVFLQRIESKYPPYIRFIDCVIWGSHISSSSELTESPWLTFVWPLARLNSAILHAVFSVLLPPEQDPR